MHFVAMVVRSNDLSGRLNAMERAPKGSGPIDLPYITDPALDALPKLAEVAGGTLSLTIVDMKRAEFLRTWAESQGHTCEIYDASSNGELP